MPDTLWPWLLRGTYLLTLIFSALLAWLHPGLEAIRIGLAVFFGLPGVLLLPGVLRLNRRGLMASSFFAIVLLMPLFAELWSESLVRLWALLSCLSCATFLALVVLYLRRPQTH